MGRSVKKRETLWWLILILVTKLDVKMVFGQMSWSLHLADCWVPIHFTDMGNPCFTGLHRAIRCERKLNFNLLYCSGRWFLDHFNLNARQIWIPHYCPHSTTELALVCLFGGFSHSSKLTISTVFFFSFRCCDKTKVSVYRLFSPEANRKKTL